MAEEADRNLIVPLFIPSQGCPFRCIYCNQQTITNRSGPLTGAEIMATMRKALMGKDLTRYKKRQIAFYGGTFTNLPVTEMERLLKIVQPFLGEGALDSIRVSTRPDCINPSIIEFLKSFGVRTVEIGAQSMDERVLLASRRGHTVVDTLRASSLIKEAGVELGIQLMAGLPDEDENSFFEGLKRVVSVDPSFVRLYPTLVLRHTELEGLYLSSKYIPLSLQAAVKLCSQAILFLETSKIPVIRVGLQNSEGLERDLVAGPYHPSFGHMVRSRAYVLRLIQTLDLKKSTPKKFFIPRPEIPLLMVYKKEGLNLLVEMTCAREIKTTTRDGGMEVELGF